MSLRLKLILGFFIPALMLLVAGFWSSYRIHSLGNQVSIMIDENERSIRYAVKMNEAIERLDSGVLLKMHGDEEAFQNIYKPAAADFHQALKMAQANITLPGESELLDSLKLLSDEFFHVIESITATDKMEYYRLMISPVFTKTQIMISNLRLLNSDAMYFVTQAIADQAARAALPGDLIILAAIVFMFLFAWLTQVYIVAPFKLILESVIKWRETGHLDDMKIETGDDIERLAKALHRISISSSDEKDK
ncbi:hypothetical protein K9N50_13425 [bacterium]|nr:hypothetical protein [bacterium]